MNAMMVQTAKGAVGTRPQPHRMSGRRVLVAVWVLTVVLALALVLAAVRSAVSGPPPVAPGLHPHPMPEPIMILTPGPH